MLQMLQRTGTGVGRVHRLVAVFAAVVDAQHLTACGVLDDGVEFGQTDAHVFGDLVIARFAAVLLFEFADCVGYRTSAAMHRARAQSGRRSSSSRSEERTSELQSLMRISYAVLRLKKKKIIRNK